MTTLLLASFVACTGPVDSGADSGEEDTGEEAVIVDLLAVGWNVESGGSTTSGLALTIDNVRGEALWGFSEVSGDSRAEWLAEHAADDGGEAFGYVMGDSQFEDHLVIAWDEGVLTRISDYELTEINIGGSARAPLVARFEVNENGAEFLFMVNHLWRSETGYRHEQARMLNDRARDQELPVIAVGDYNFDWDVDEGDDGDRDEGYDYMVEDDVWTWVRPDPLRRTHCSDYDSILDFAFVTEAVLDWSPVGETVTVDDGWCPDGGSRSDHRPVSVAVEIPG